MKARVKVTGKILPETTIVSFYDDGSMDDFFLNELELIPDDNSPDYWTRLEHTYAGEFMRSFLDNFDGTASMAQLTDDAIDLARAFVQKLKEKEERK